MGDIVRLVATNVTTGVISNSGHWVMEEQPAETTAAIVEQLVMRSSRTIAPQRHRVLRACAGGLYQRSR
jgi:hypothetical protein